MALTPSNMVELGSEAPDFALPDTVSGAMLSLSELKSEKATVVMFICNHCPLVKFIQDALVALGNEYIEKDVSFIAISSNNVETHPDDSPEKMKEVAEQHKYPFPYLYDESQSVARAYDATCTPDFFVYDGDLKLAYRGQLDDARPNSGTEPTGADIRAALDSILSGNPVNGEQKPSVGCNIKWKE